MQPAQLSFKCEDGVVTGADASVALWINQRLGGGLVEVPFVAIGVVHPGLADDQVDEVNLAEQLAAGVYFYNYRNDAGGSEVYASVAADWFAAGHPQVIRKVLEYPFDRWKVKRITVEIDEANDRSIRQAEKLGFKLEGLKRRAGANGGDVAIYGLLPDECPIWTREAA